MHTVAFISFLRSSREELSKRILAFCKGFFSFNVKCFRDYAAKNTVKDWLFIHLQMQGPSAFIDNVISYLWSFINQRPPLIQVLHVYP